MNSWSHRQPIGSPWQDVCRSWNPIAPIEALAFDTGSPIERRVSPMAKHEFVKV